MRSEAGGRLGRNIQGQAVPGLCRGASGRPEMAADPCQQRQEQQHQRCQVDQAGLHRHMSCERAFSSLSPLPSLQALTNDDGMIHGIMVRPSHLLSRRRRPGRAGRQDLAPALGGGAERWEGRGGPGAAGQDAGLRHSLGSVRHSTGSGGETGRGGLPEGRPEGKALPRGAPAATALGGGREAFNGGRVPQPQVSARIAAASSARPSSLPRLVLRRLRAPSAARQAFNKERLCLMKNASNLEDTKNPYTRCRSIAEMSRPFERGVERHLHMPVL